MKTYSFIFLEPGFKIVITHRRLFEKDKPRLFVGTVDAFDNESGLLKVTGFSFYPRKGARWEKKLEKRTKIVSLTAGTLIVYQLPNTTRVDEVEILNEKRGILLTDGTVKLDLSEPGD